MRSERKVTMARITTLIVILLYVACGDRSGIHHAMLVSRDASAPEMTHAPPTDTGSFDVFSNYDADVFDAGALIPPTLGDAGQICELPQGGMSVPCVRWAPGGASCWFLSSINAGDFDSLCEDDLPAGGWCQCYGDDWGAEQHADIGPNSFPCCRPPY